MGKLPTGNTEYPAALQLYTKPPTMDISLEQFEEWAVDRLRLLRTVETQNMGGRTKFSQDWSGALVADLTKHKLGKYVELSSGAVGAKITLEDYLENRRVDHISHFILRLAYCRTEELRRWFVNHETDLFRLRWNILKEQATNSSQDHIGEFMAAANLKYQPIGEEEKDSLKEDLQAASGLSGTKTSYEDIYRVPWTEAVDLVRSRRVLVRGGWAYIPAGELLSLVVGVFRARLSHNLVLTCRALPQLEEDGRLVSLVHNLDKRYTGEDYGSNKNNEKVLPAQIDPLSKTNFPACMKAMQDVMSTTHHIKYKARLQYGLFLKGIGLTLEDAMKFFRGEFVKRTDVDVDKFEKEYAYGIRYNYGKEGKKKNWQPYDCMRIIMESVGPGENHGCPFRHHEGRTLRQRVEGYDLKGEAVDAIMKKVEEGHYQVACSMHYSAVHLKDLSTGTVAHPNQWYMESRGLVGEGGGKSNKHIKTTKGIVYTSQDGSKGSQQESQDETVFEDMDDSELLDMMDTGTQVLTENEKTVDS